jgi:hypothetical protein
MIRTALAGALCIIAGASSNAMAQACDCGPETTLEDRLANASVVFVGQASDTRRNPLKPGEVEVRFAVSNRFKGFEEVLTEQIVVYSKLDAGQCGYQFHTGADYLVFAQGNPAHYVTTACDGTDILESSSLAVEKLIRLTGKRPLSTPTPIPSLAPTPRPLPPLPRDRRRIFDDF